MSDKDIKEILEKLKSVEKKVDALIKSNSDVQDLLEDNSELTEDIIEDAVFVIVQAGKVSASYLQRKLGITFSLACKLVDLLEDEDAIGPAYGAKPREVLIDDPASFLSKRKSN